jgi:hypothetical protein
VRLGGGRRERREEDVTTQGSDLIDLNLADKLEFRVNHEAVLIESSNPDIYVRDRGGPTGTTDRNMRYFSLHWNGREISVRADWRVRTLGQNESGQWIGETHWIVMEMGYPDYAAQGGGGFYEFKSQDERICAANLILKAIKTYGGAVNTPAWNYFPEFRQITAELHERLRADIYGGLN